MCYYVGDIMYKNYIFDLYGTLVDINTDEDYVELWEEMAEFYSIHQASYTPAELRKSYHELCKKEEERHIKKYKNITHHEIDVHDVFKKLYTNKGVKVNTQSVTATAQYFRILSTKYIKLYDGAIELLKTLRQKGKSVYLLSNAQHDFTYYEICFLDIEKYFDGILISSNEKVKKPDPYFYQILFERYNLNKEESIMIGNDKSSDIAGANNFGIDSLYFYSNISPKEDLSLPNNATYTIDGVNYKEIEKLIIK